MRFSRVRGKRPADDAACTAEDFKLLFAAFRIETADEVIQPLFQPFHVKQCEIRKGNDYIPAVLRIDRAIDAPADVIPVSDMICERLHGTASRTIMRCVNC